MNFSKCRTPTESLQEYGRGVTGGLMFSLPLLFTMEVWWASFLLHPLRLFCYVASTFGVLMAYNRFAGLRRDATWWECAIDSVEEMGIGILLSALVLWVLGRLNGDMSANEIVEKILMEAMTVAIGVSVGTAQLGGGMGQDDTGMHGAGDDELAKKDERPQDFLSQIVIAFCGGVLFAANIAPTEEVVVIAQESPFYKLLLIALLSLLLGGYILFFAEFRGAGLYSQSEGTFDLVRGIISTYAVALLASASALYFFGRFDGQTLHLCLAQTVVIGLTATLGASAGRLLLQGNSGDEVSND